MSSVNQPKRGRPRGQPKAERRLRRELSNKQALLDVLGTVRDVVTELVRSSTTNPVIGVVTGLTTLDILARSRVISPLTWAAGITIVGVLTIAEATSAVLVAAGTVAAGAGNIIPSIGAKGSINSPVENLISPTVTTNVDAREKRGIGAEASALALDKQLKP